MQTIIGSAMKDQKSERFRDIRLLGVFTLAVAATGTAIFMSMLAGWQRGGWLSERIIWCAISVVLVLCAHLMPALCREASTIVRWIAGGLWVASMTAVSCGHATFFLLSQQHAGERRADAIAVVAAPVARVAPSGRSLTAIAAEQATFKAALGTASEQCCARSCAHLRANRIALSAKLDALNVEADEAKRWERAEDRAIARENLVTTLRDSARDDPVTARLAVWAGTTAGKLNLLLAFAFAAELECVACLCWYIALRLGRRVRMPVDEAVVSSVAPLLKASMPPSHESRTDSHATPDESAMTAPPVVHDGYDHHDETLLQLRRDIAAGQVRATVAEIRRHLGCSQARAAGVRRQIGEMRTPRSASDLPETGALQKADRAAA
jgi:hypothetical protein